MQNLIDKYSEIKSKIQEIEALLKPLKAEESVIKSEIKKLYDESGKEKLFLDSSDGNMFKCFMKDGQRLTNFDLLQEILDETLYNKVVTKSSYLMISKATKKELAEMKIKGE